MQLQLLRAVCRWILFPRSSAGWLGRCRHKTQRLLRAGLEGGFLNHGTSTSKNFQM
jgi:hypothetical protein